MAYPTYPDTFTKEVTIGDKKITLEIGKFSQQTAASVVATCGETIVHTTIGLGRKVDLGYFPLSVEFAEKLYSGGIIKGSRWVKRDGRPLDEVILKARLIDRTMRPLFPEGIKHEVQVINTVFSFDGENDPDMLGLLATGVGMSISEIPFDGPVSGLRVGYSKETKKFSFNPTHEERAESDLDLIVSGGIDSVVMVEAGANEVSEEVVLEGIELAQEQLSQVCGVINEMVKEIGKTKVELLDTPDPEQEAAKTKVDEVLSKDFSKEINQAVEDKAHLRPVDLDAVKEQIVEEHGGEGSLINEKLVGKVIDKQMKEAARAMILEKSKRPDGRKTDEIRPIWCEVDLFPRTHGSAMFKRGATQGVTVTTIGTPRLGQTVESIKGQEMRYYMHMYNMPPYAFGGTGRFGFAKRREIGHGALAERALLPMIPNQEEFPYAIVVVSEILSSNGSTSQAAVCGSTLSLMAAGVPIKRPVSGIAMGMISDGKGKNVILSDIQGLEDHIGDMDFKVAGSEEGITAIQMDIKLKGLTRDILKQALEQSKVGRLHILKEMLKAIDSPRESISQYAPKIEQVTIPIEKIGALIGPGGKIIKALIEETGAQIDVEEDEEKKIGIVVISSPDQEKIDGAVERVSNMMRVVEIDEEFEGTITRIENYGAFAEYLPGREGLIHVSEMSADYIDHPEKVVQMGGTVKVRINEIKDDGKIGLSLLSKEESEKNKSNSGGRPPFRGGRSGGVRPQGGGYGRSGGDRRGGGGRRGPRGGGGSFRPRGGNNGGSNNRQPSFSQRQQEW